MILSQYVDIYVSESAFYLYQRKGYWDDVVTQIAKFDLSDGKMNAVGAVSANGRVTDTFAVNECEGKLRVLTSGQNAVSGEAENNLYLFDENLNLTGKIEGLAQGEEIYAARYLGNMAYFVTYRNTDPLFAVDLSDDKNPKVLGELKISGFSEYLHFWGEDKLVGIGYETDEKTGEHAGIKITMFDISDSSSLKEMNSLVLKIIITVRHSIIINVCLRMRRKICLDLHCSPMGMRRVPHIFYFHGMEKNLKHCCRRI